MQGNVDLTGYHLSFDAEMTDAKFLNYYFINTFNNGDTTNKADGENETYTSDSNLNAPGSNYSLQNGEMTITAQPASPGSSTYTSGLLNTGYSFNQNTGYFEIRAQLPSGAGFWPAFWMLGAGPVDYSSEIDVEEQPNNDGPNNYFTSVKTPLQPGYTFGGFNNAGIDLSQAYHAYGFMWTPNSVQFTLDGQYIGQAVATPPELANLKMYLIANLAVGGYGSWPGQPVSGSTAQEKIDYIRAYSNDSAVPSWWGGTVTDGGQLMSSPDGVNTMPNLTGTPLPPPLPPMLPPTPTPTPTPPVTPTTTDTLTVGVSEDAYQGDAQYKVLVDGVDTGSTYTATASHSAGAITTQTISGNWGMGAHTLGIQFINDLYDGSPSADRNLYVNSVNYDGNQIGMSTVAQYANGTTNVAVPKTNTLTLQLAEDAYKGDAQFSVTVDGRLINQPTSVTASHAAGASQAFSLETGLTGGTHDIGVTFLNDAYGGSPSLDRNLYVTGAQLNGTALSSSAWTTAIDTNSTSHFNLVVPS